MIERENKIHYAWWTLVALCIIVGLGKGSLNNSASLFLGPVSEDLGIGMGQLTLYLSISAIVTLFYLPLTGKIMAKFDSRLVIVAAILMQSGAFAAFGFMNSVWGWYLFSVPLSLGGTLIMVIVGPVLINQWFQKKQGLALGILNAAAGAMGALTQPFISRLIANKGWSFTYVAVGVVVILISVPVALLFIKKSPDNYGVEPYGAVETNDDSENVADASELTQGISIEIARKNFSFYALILFFFLIVSVSSFSMHIPRYLIDQGFDVEFTGNVMGYYMFGMLILSLLIGILIDKIGAKYTAVVSMIIGLSSIILLLTANNATVIIIAVSMFSVVSSSIATVGPALTSSLFGPKNYGEIYSVGSLGLGIASIIALPAYGYLFDLVGSYDSGLYAIVVMLTINIIAIFLAFKNKEKLVNEGHWN